jgi:hypothetical protein
LYCRRPQSERTYGQYVVSDWQRTTYYNGISPDHPELLYRSDLLENPSPIPKGRHPHLPTKTVYGVFNTPLNAVWDTVAPQIREFLKARKIRYQPSRQLVSSLTARAGRTLSVPS